MYPVRFVALVPPSQKAGWCLAVSEVRALSPQLVHARALVQQARWEEAAARLRPLARDSASAELEEALELLADVLLTLGGDGPQEAYETLQAVLTASPQLHRARLRLGWLLCGAGQYQAVLAELGPALDDATAPPELYECLARALWELGRVDDAVHAMAAAAGKRGELQRWTAGFPLEQGIPTAVGPFNAPRRPLRIGLVLRSGEISFSEQMLDTHPLGGTETAILRMARALRELGHEVYFEQFPERLQRLQGVDVLIVKRHPVLLDPPFAKVNYFWAPDDVDQPFWDRLREPDFRQRFLASTTRLFALSQYQAKRMLSLGIPEEQIAETRNGIDPRLFEQVTPDEGPRPPVAVYTSDPSRGLRILLDLWPDIRRQVPNATLRVFSSMRLYLRGSREKPEHQQLYAQARDMAGVEYMGSVPQQQLATELLNARVLLYPNTFPETSCIAAIEAQAAGCAVVTSNLGALPETAWGNAIIYAAPGSPAYNAAFVARAVELLRADDLWRSISTRNRERMRAYTWPAVAREWLALMAADLAA